MEVNRDLILRNIKYLSEFLSALLKQNTLQMDEIDHYINEFTNEHYNMSLKSILEKDSDKIINIISGNDNSENIKDFADLLFIIISIETNMNWKKQSQKVIQLYKIYAKKSKTYSLESQLKIKELEENY